MDLARWRRTRWPRRAVLWPRRPGAAGLPLGRPASGGPAAGIPGPGSSAGSNAAAGTAVCSLCADRAVHAVVAHWHSEGTLVYRGGSPRERYLPRDSPGGTRERSSRALIQNRELDQEGQSILRQKERDREGNSFRKAPEEPDDQNTPTAFIWLFANAQTGSVLPLGAKVLQSKRLPSRNGRRKSFLRR